MDKRKANPSQVNTAQTTFSQQIKKALFFVLGLALVALGAIGAVYCFARSYPRFEHWLCNHPIFGPLILDWQQYRVIPLKAKCIACLSMAVSYIYVVVWVDVSIPLKLAIGAFMICAAIYVLRKPSTKACDLPDQKRSSSSSKTMC